MIAETDIAIEYAPGSPCVAERRVWHVRPAVEALREMLTRFGLPPHLVGIQAGGSNRAPGEILITGRDHAGKAKIIGRVMWGLRLEDLQAARDELVSDGWQPKPPTFDMELPDGRAV